MTLKRLAVCVALAAAAGIVAAPPARAAARPARYSIDDVIWPGSAVPAGSYEQFTW
jgi:hypothetical protein